MLLLQSSTGWEILCQAFFFRSLHTFDQRVKENCMHNNNNGSNTAKVQSSKLTCMHLWNQVEGKRLHQKASHEHCMHTVSEENWRVERRRGKNRTAKKLRNREKNTHLHTERKQRMKVNNSSARNVKNVIMYYGAILVDRLFQMAQYECKIRCTRRRLWERCTFVTNAWLLLWLLPIGLSTKVNRLNALCVHIFWFQLAQIICNNIEAIDHTLGVFDKLNAHEMQCRMGKCFPVCGWHNATVAPCLHISQCIYSLVSPAEKKSNEISTRKRHSRRPSLTKVL